MATIGEPRVDVVQLPNGLRLFAARVPWLARGVIDAHVAVGPHYESSRDHGLSHFLEHMLYRGTPSYSTAHGLVSAIEGQGGYLDAMTYCDHGVLSLSSPAESLLGLLPVFAEVFQRPLLGQRDPASIEVERGIVREEINEEVDERGRQVEPENLVRSMCFGKHAMGRSITGNLRSLARFDSARLQAHHALHYTAANSVIGVVSPLPTTKVLKALEAEFKGLPRGEPLTPPRAPGRARARLHVPHASSQTSIRLCFHAVHQNHRLEPATQLLLRTLDDGMSTRLYARLSDELGLCYDVSAQFEAYANAGLIELAAETQHDQLVQVVAELLELARSLRRAGPSMEEFELAKRRHAWQLNELLAAPEDLAELIGLELLTRRAVSRLPLAARRESFDQVTLRDVRDAARLNFAGARASLLTVGHLKRAAAERVNELLNDFIG